MRERMQTPRLSELVQYVDQHCDELNSLVVLVEREDPTTIAGSGTLLKVAGVPFLVTASHVVKACTPQGGALLPLFRDCRFLSVEADGIVGRDDDKHDVAVMRLSEHVAAQLVDDGRYFLSTAHVETVPPAELSTGRCLVLGFPCEYTRLEGRTMRYGPEGLVLELASPDNADSLSSEYDPAHHYLLEYADVGTEVHSGEHEPIVKPHGMSGGSVWWLGSEDDLGSVQQRAQNIRWIGVQSSVFAAARPGGGFLKAVTLESAAELMRRRWPELCPSLDLHRFRSVPRTPWVSR